MHTVKKFVFITSFLLLGSGCSSRVHPVASIETARLAIEEANRNEAPRYAPSEYNLAQQKLSLAEQETKKGNSTPARRLGEQATVDARYAQVRAQAEKAQAVATENRDTTETIKGTR